MKKLALALVCLVSVAFFASCKPEGDPTIQVLIEEGYVQSGDVVDVNTDFNFGFVMASSAQTGKELASLIIKIDDEDPDTLTITGTEYTYKGTLRYEFTRDDIVGESTITAIVTDAAGKTASKSITLSINNPAQLLTVTDFTWNRHGGVDATGLDVFGLQWKKNERAIYAVIEPLEGSDAVLYQFDPANWETVNYDTEKAALFENAIAISQWKEFNTAGAVNQDLDILLGSIYQGEMHLMHITKGHIESFKGTDVTLTGQAK